MRKNHIFRVCLTSSALALLMSNIASASTFGTVTATTLNVRQNPTTASQILDQVHYGDSISILSKQGDWFQIELENNKIAYVSSNYVKATSTNVVSVITGHVTVQILNFRSSPEIKDNNIIGKLNLNQSLTINYSRGDWYYVTTSTNQKGYVYNKYVKINASKVTSNTVNVSAVNTTTGYVTVSVLNFRSSPEIKNNNIIGKLKLNQSLTINSKNRDWYYVTTSDNKKGYVYSTYITTSNSTANTSISDIPSQVIAYAKQFLGNPYVYGGTSLTNGVDCSSFVQQILGKFGYRISRTSSMQYANDGFNISVKDLLPGDLIFYGYSGVVSHVGMYIGNGMIIHASSPSTGIIISGIFSQGRKPFIGAKRIILNP